VTTRRERALRRQIRETWSEILKERSDHVRAAALHRKLAELRDDLRKERESG